MDHRPSDRRRMCSAMRGPDRGRGQTAVEYVGVITLLLFIALVAIQLGLVAYTAQQAGTASRAAARAASDDSFDVGAQQAGEQAMSGWLADQADFSVQYGGEEVSVTATVQVPRLLPVFRFDDAERTTTMPRD